MKPIRLAGIERESIVDGPGIRFTVFVQGCPHHCPGCHNPQTHDPNGGYDIEVDKIVTEFLKDPLLQGITLSGGEPMDQAEALLPLAKKINELGKNVAIFTGYTIEKLLEKGKDDHFIIDLLNEAFLLIDGPFIIKEKDLTLVFRGSRNQRLLDPRESIKQGKSVKSSRVYDI